MVLIVSAPVTVFGEPLHDTQAEVANDSAETNEPPLESGNGSSGKEQEAMEEPAGEPEELPEPTQKAEPEANSIQGSGSLLGAGSVGLGWLKSGTLSSTIEVGLADSLQFSLVRDGSDEAVGYKIVAVIITMIRAKQNQASVWQTVANLLPEARLTEIHRLFMTWLREP